MKKIGLLGLSLVALAVTAALNNANAQTIGEVSLTIDPGTSSCNYGTAINLGSQSIAADFGALTFQGDFMTPLATNAWSCTDFAGTPGGWDLTIQSSDLTNETSNIISATNVSISHDAPQQTAGTCTVGWAGATNVSIDAAHTIIAKAGGSERTVCTVEAANVNLEVAVPANQAPGTYVGTLTITLPVFN